VVAIEVKSGASAGRSDLLVGGDGIPVEAFLARPVEEIVALTGESR
jgi:hypothetical protein